MIMEYCEHGKMWEGGGINVSIICIVTLFLTEYCGFGWVVGTFFWVFWFCFGIAWRTKFKHWWSLVLRRAGPPLPPLRPSSALRASSGLRGGNGGPARRRTSDHQCLNFVLQAIPKKIKISEKSPNYQPKPQYQPKKRHYLYNIYFFFW